MRFPACKLKFCLDDWQDVRSRMRHMRYWNDWAVRCYTVYYSATCILGYPAPPVVPLALLLIAKIFRYDSILLNRLRISHCLLTRSVKHITVECTNLLDICEKNISQWKLKVVWKRWQSYCYWFYQTPFLSLTAIVFVNLILLRRTHSVVIHHLWHWMAYNVLMCR